MIEFKPTWLWVFREYLLKRRFTHATYTDLDVVFGDLDMWLDAAFILPTDITTWAFRLVVVEYTAATSCYFLLLLVPPPRMYTPLNTLRNTNSRCLPPSPFHKTQPVQVYSLNHYPQGRLTASVSERSVDAHAAHRQRSRSTGPALPALHAHGPRRRGEPTALDARGRRYTSTDPWRRGGRC